ncbi:MAG: hypothetical protein LBS07_06020, partial [Prevotellaceae bacterium]|nr:hypothetical protein [Prevotellaceae bacterium]
VSVAGAVAALFEKEYAPYVFSFGAALIIFYQFMESLNIRKTGDFRLQRLRRIAFLSSTLLAAAAYLMFTGSNLWVAAALIYAVTTMFLSFRGEK